jgi:hypothetical protein
MAFGVPVTLCFAALVAAGAVGKVLKATMTSTAVMVALTAPGAWFGLLYTGWANVAAAAFDAALFLWVTRDQLGFRWIDLRAALLRSALVAACAAFAPALALLVFGARPEHAVAPIALGLLGSAAGFVAAVFVFRHPISAEVARLWTRVFATRGA